MKSFITCALGLLLTIGFMTGCKQSMVISKVDYSQSIESVLTPNEEGIVEDVEHGLKFSIMPLQYAESQDTSSVMTKEVRYIRGQEGYYYITAPNYRNVYVMTPENSSLKLEKKLEVAENGISQPAFNQRTDYIQLLNLSSGDSWKLYPEGVEKESQMAKNNG